MVGTSLFSVRFWGVRGTVACPGPDTFRYGGNTACVEVRCGDHRLILDAGTGLRPLGEELARTGDTLRAHFFLTHTHLDHILGLPFFKPAFIHGNRLDLWNGHLRCRNRKLREVLCTLMEEPLFPVPLDILHAHLAFHDFDAGETHEPMPGVRLRTAPLNHPGGATGYRIEFEGRSICYVTDTEHIEGRRDKAISRLIENSDLVIYDATYTDEEYPRYRGWGHSTWQEGVRLCQGAGAKRLVTFHHDPERCDTALDRMAVLLEQAMPSACIGREGLVLEV